MADKPLVLVAGDALLDHNRFVTYSRMSPEEPNCPIGINEKQEWVLGGAANVARWVKGLGDVGQVHLIAHSAARAPHGTILAKCLEAAGVWQSHYLERLNGRLTIKERLYLRGENNIDPWRQVIRIDSDTDMELTREEAQKLRGHLELSLANERPAAIVIADYGKGVFTGDHWPLLLESLENFVIEHQVPTVINSKYPNRWHSFETDFFVCNQRENQTLRGGPIAARHLIVTRADEGVSAFVKGGAVWALHQEHASSLAVDVRDVTGAGDAFLAGLTSHLVRTGFTRGKVLGNGSLRAAIDEGQSAAAACVYQLGCGVPARLGLGEVG